MQQSTVRLTQRSASKEYAVSMRMSVAVLVGLIIVRHKPPLLS